MTSKFSIDNRELLQRISSGEAVVGIDFGNLIVRELAAFRLAAMDSEPDCKERKLFCSTDTTRMRKTISVSAGTEDAPLYRHAQPVPVVPQDVLEALQKVARIRLDMNDFDGDRRGIADCLGDAEEALIEVVNRRAAMLAAAPHDTPALNSVQSVVTGSDTWIQVSERMPEKGQAVLVYRPKAHEGGDSDVRVAVYGRHNFEHGFGCYWEPSHWMPLPAAPQEVGDA